MRILDYFYYRYFVFQTKVGDGDIAHWTAAQILAVLLSIVLFDIQLLIDWVFRLPIESFNPKKLVAIPITLMIIFTWVFVIKKRYLTVVQKYKNESVQQGIRGDIYAFLVPVIAFSLIIICAVCTPPRQGL